MRKCKKLLHKAGVFCLATVLLMNASAFAVESGNSSLADTRQEDLDFLYENLKTYHPDVYANTPEETFVSRKAEIESHIGTESNAEFVLDLQSLVSLVRDSHTQLSINSIADATGYYPMGLSWFNGQWVLSAAETTHQDLLGLQVTSVNGLSMDQVLERFSKLISADNPIKLRRQYRQSCNVEELYHYTGVIEDNAPLTLTLRDSTGQDKPLTLNALDADSLKALSISSLSKQRKATPVTVENSKNYSAMALDSETYYIQYNNCAEDPDLPMETFCTQIKTALDAGNYQQVLVDLRYNGGGSDGVLFPLLELLRQEMDSKDLQVAALIGETTFSSAIINAVELQEMGCILAGEPTSGSVDHFGSVSGFKLPNSGLKVQVSSKYIALSNFFDAAAGKGVESLTPDVDIPQTLTDYLAGRDTCVEKLLADPSCLKAANRGSAPLTRCRFVGMLYKAAGSPEQTVEQTTFSDLFGIEWYLPAIRWAAKENVALGTGSNKFSGSCTLTWQEAAVFLVRSVHAIGLEPTGIIVSQPPEVLMAGTWGKEAIEQAWKWGLIPQNANFAVPPTRAQGESMAEALRQAVSVKSSS